MIHVRRLLAPFRVTSIWCAGECFPAFRRCHLPGHFGQIIYPERVRDVVFAAR